jgi:ABC-type multidrug transport system ATPase subunit
MLLECRNIEFKYPGTEKIILNNVSFGFSQPGFHAIFGPSGVGKTSMAHIITGRLKPDSGRVITNGMDTLFYSYNMERLPGWSSVGRHLERITPAHKTTERDALIKAFGLTALLKHRFSQLSMGQQNRINLLRYLVQDFQLLIMDESLANVDEKTRSHILLTIKEMFPQTLFITISHNVVEVAKFCGEIWVMRDVSKSPQMVLVQGEDHSHHKPVEHQNLQRIMLEIMNAA